MNEHIKLSIIIPVYNLESYIERCIKSIRTQTHENLEIIIVDDGSTDNSKKVIEKISKLDKRIVSIYKDNGGVTSARLMGIKHATGDWIGFVDGDDEIENDMYDFLLENALKYDAEISHCGYQMIFSDGRINFFHNSETLRIQDNTTGIKDLLDGKIVEPGLWNKLYKRKLFNNILDSTIIDTDIKINEDLLMNYYLFSKSKLSVFADVCKYRYLVRNTSVSRTKLDQNKIFDPIKVKRIILENIDIKLLPFAQKAYLSTCINVYNCLILEKYGCYIEEKKIVREEILNHYQWISKLSKKQKILLKLIRYMMPIYPLIYKFYERYFLENRYS